MPITTQQSSTFARRPVLPVRLRVAAVAAVSALLAGGLAWRLWFAGPLDASFGPLRLRAKDPVESLIAALVLTGICAVALAGRRAGLAIVAMAIAAAASHWLVAAAERAPHGYPVADAALLESYTWLTTRGRLLLGPYSRFAWHHPGPLLFWLLAPFYAMAGFDTPGLNAGALAVNLASIATLVWIIRRAARGSTAVVLLAAVTMYVWRTSDLIVSAWNPHVTVFAAFALAVLSAVAAAGDAAILPVVALFASFVTQTHIGFTPFAAACSAYACVGAWLARTTSPARIDGGDAAASSIRITPLRRALVRSAVVLLVVWSFPLADQIAHTPGNMTRILRFFLLEHQGGQPPVKALLAWADAVTAAFRPGFHLPYGVLFVPYPGPWLVIAMGLIVAGLAWSMQDAWRHARRFEASLAGVTILACAVSCASVLRITENLVDHELHWMSAIGWLAVAVIAATIVHRTRFESARGIGFAVAMAVLSCAPVVLPAYWGARGLAGTRELPLGVRLDDRIVRDLSGGIERFMRSSGARKPLVRMDVTTWGFTAGVVLQLQRAGIDVAVEDGAVPLFSDAAAIDGREDVEVVISRAPRHAELAARPGNVIVASRDGLFADARLIAPNPNR